jgi:hypothetical protein
MPSLLTEEDAGGTRYLRAGAIPVVVAAIAVPVVVAMLLSVLAIEATAIGMAAGAAAVATLLVLAGRLRPRGKLEVAARTDAERRLLVIAADEVTADVADRVARIAEGAADVRLVVPVSSRRIDRWLSAEDAARAEAQNRLAHSAGALVAAGLPVSGSLGDNDVAQALEDELRGYPADRVVLVGDRDSEERLQPALDRLDVGYDRVG